MSSPTDQYHLNTNELVIDGHLRGQPFPSVFWVRDGQTVDPDGTLQQFEHADGTVEFIVTNPQRWNSGKYICKAENYLGRAEMGHWVAFEGREMALDENIHSVYHVDHHKLKEREEQERQKQEEAREDEEDRLAEEKAAEEAAEAAGTFRRGKPQPISRSQKILNEVKTKIVMSAQLTNRVAAVGSKVKLSCYVEGHEPHFAWLKDGQPMSYLAGNVRNSSRDNLGVLEFFDVQLRDSGEYTCVINNIAGELKTSASLLVYEDLVHVEVAPTFTRGIRGQWSRS